MAMSRWGHGHSLGAGVLVALLAQRHAALILTVVFGLGLLTGRLWASWGTLVRSAAWRLRRG